MAVSRTYQGCYGRIYCTLILYDIISLHFKVMLVKNSSSSKLYRLKVISVLNWLDDLVFSSFNSMNENCNKVKTKLLLCHILEMKKDNSHDVWPGLS